MRIAVSADTDRGLEAPVSPHFGRCPFYTLVDVEGPTITSVSAVVNPHYPDHVPGVIPEFIHNQGANVMLTGGMGYRAVTFFEQYNIQPVTGAAGTVGEAVGQFLSGRLVGAAPCSESVAHAQGGPHH
jgi:predicted Fe-Mo cluster-binding NifX family protein